MAVWSEVELFSLEGDLRIDAEYYQPAFLQTVKEIYCCNHPVVPLGSLVQSGYRVVYENTEILNEDFNSNLHVKFLQAANVTSGFPAIAGDNMGWVLRKDWERYVQGHIKPGELLIEVKGKAEKVVVVPEDFPTEVLVSGSLYKMTLNPEKVNPYYILAYMLSRYGRTLRDRSKTNTLISYVNKDQLYAMPVPLPPLPLQNEIAQLCHRAEKRYRSTKSLYAEAETLILPRFR